MSPWGQSVGFLFISFLALRQRNQHFGPVETKKVNKSHVAFSRIFRIFFIYMKRILGNTTNKTEFLELWWVNIPVLYCHFCRLSPRLASLVEARPFGPGLGAASRPRGGFEKFPVSGRHPLGLQFQQALGLQPSIAIRPTLNNTQLPQGLRKINFISHLPLGLQY